jgi:hypothetical protein
MLGRRMVGIVLVLAVAGVALAGISIEAYRELPPAEVPTRIRGGGHSAGDTEDLSAGPLATSGAGLSVFALSGNPTIACSPRISVANAMVGLRCVLWHHQPGGTYTFAGVAGVASATASGAQDATGMYVSDTTYLWDGGGATHYEIRLVGAPTTSATVDLVAWSYGADSRRAR